MYKKYKIKKIFFLSILFVISKNFSMEDKFSILIKNFFKENGSVYEEEGPVDTHYNIHTVNRAIKDFSNSKIYMEIDETFNKLFLNQQVLNIIRSNKKSYPYFSPEKRISYKNYICYLAIDNPKLYNDIKNTIRNFSIKGKAANHDLNIALNSQKIMSIGSLKLDNLYINIFDINNSNNNKILAIEQEKLPYKNQNK